MAGKTVSVVFLTFIIQKDEELCCMSGSLQKLEWKQFFCVKIKGYCDRELGNQLEEAVMAFLTTQGNTWILDLTECEVVNSPAVSAVLELTLRTLEDFSGRIIIVGGNVLTKRVFTMAGIFPLAEEYPTLEEIAGILS
jgi:anti-anti-sigma factor